MNIKDAEDKLQRAIRRLEQSVDKGKIGRRNARAEFAKALRALRGAVNETFPPILDGVKRERLTQKQKVNRLRKANFEPLHEESEEHFSRLAEAKAPIKRCGSALWVPSWVNDLSVLDDMTHDQHVSWLRRMRKPTERDTVRAEVAIFNAEGVGLAAGVARAATARCKRDREFVQAVLAVELLGPEEVKKAVESLFLLLNKVNGNAPEQHDTSCG